MPFNLNMGISGTASLVLRTGGTPVPLRGRGATLQFVLNSPPSISAMRVSRHALSNTTTPLAALRHTSTGLSSAIIALDAARFVNDAFG